MSDPQPQWRVVRIGDGRARIEHVRDGEVVAVWRGAEVEARAMIAAAMTDADLLVAPEWVDLPEADHVVDQ